MGKASRARQEKIAKVLGYRAGQELREKARLFDLVNSAENSYNPDVIQASVGSYVWPIDDSICVVVDNVVEMLDKTPSISYQLPTDQLMVRLGTLRMPFEKMFVEWAWPQRQAVSLLWLGPDDHDKDSPYRWQIMATTYSIPIEGENAISQFGSMFIVLDDDGLLVTYDFCPDANSTDKKERLFHAVFIALMTLSLLNCRNVELIDSPPPDPALAASYERHFGQPMTRYKLLRIKPTRKEYDTEREGESLPSHKALHIVRGNFAQYTDTAPLFGKYVGTFWRPAHVRGEEKYGVVVKDYAVDAPDSN